MTFPVCVDIACGYLKGGTCTDKMLNAYMRLFLLLLQTHNFYSKRKIRNSVIYLLSTFSCQLHDNFTLINAGLFHDEN